MLGKLLKHEFRATGRVLLPVLGALALLTLLANLSLRVMASGVNSQFVEMLTGLFIALFFIGIIAAWIMAVVVMVSRFYRNLLKDEGYLMFTLPTDPHTLVWSKLIVSSVWFVVTGLIIFLVFFLTVMNIVHLEGARPFADFPPMSLIMEELNKLGITGGTLAVFLLEMLASIVVACLTLSLHFYAAMSLGHMASEHKVLLSIVAFIGINLAFQIIATAIGAGVLENMDQMEMVYSSYDLGPLQAIRNAEAAMGGAILVEIARGAILYVITVLGLKKGLNMG